MLMHTMTLPTVTEIRPVLVAVDRDTFGDPQPLPPLPWPAPRRRPADA